MNTRILELLKNPQDFKQEDLKPVQQELNNNPFAQSLRALYLLGTYRFNADQFPMVLSSTAAYTTDKKILYHFINGFQKNNTSQNFENETIQNEIETVTTENFEQNFETATESLETQQNEITNNTEIEEQPIDIQEFNLTKKINENSDEIVEDIFVQENLEEEKQSIVSENTIKNEEKSSQLSYHAFETFLPDVKFENANEDAFPQPQIQQLNRHEEEMKRLIEEVERKMKLKKEKNISIEKNAEQTPQNTQEVSFAETQEFVVSKEKSPQNTASTEIQEIQKNEDQTIEISANSGIEATNEISAEPQKVWQPLQLSGNLPDALIQNSEKTTQNNLKVEEKFEKTITPNKEVSEIEKVENTEEKPSKELPVMNVSFFSPQVSNIISDEKSETISNDSLSDNEESNVPKFINTWKSWLKIDHFDPKENEVIKEILDEDKKTKLIEKFIETEPKISQLKDENNFVIKEKKGDISHLMTETLAKLYTEQKLYAKAIKAYGVLGTKHPEKKNYFDTKIEEVKEIKNKNSEQK